MRTKGKRKKVPKKLSEVAKMMDVKRKSQKLGNVLRNRRTMARLTKKGMPANIEYM